jgi:hypothetical protein
LVGKTISHSGTLEKLRGGGITAADNALGTGVGQSPDVPPKRLTAMKAYIRSGMVPQ